MWQILSTTAAELTKPDSFHTVHSMENMEDNFFPLTVCMNYKSFMAGFLAESLSMTKSVHIVLQDHPGLLGMKLQLLR